MKETGDKEKRIDRAHMVRRLLNSFFPSPPLPLHHLDSYTLLIAVLLSARCTDKKVNEITPHLFALAKTPQEMITLTIEQIVAVIRPCGLAPAKGKAIWELSQILVSQYGGALPQTMEGFEALPGVGHKTAAVLTLQVLKQPAFPVDTHIHRCAKRWGLSRGATVKETERDLMSLFPKPSWGLLHLQIIYYARKYCPARGHMIGECPICKSLAASPFSHRFPDDFPKP